MAHAPLKGSPPQEPPFSSFGFIWIKKLDSKNFKLKQAAAKFSANTTWLLFYLFAKSFCCLGTEVQFLAGWYCLCGILAVSFRHTHGGAVRSNSGAVETV